MPCCTPPPPPCPHTFAFHPDGRLFALRDRLVIWTPANRPLTARADTFEKGVRHDGLTFAPDGRRFAVMTDPADVTRVKIAKPDASMFSLRAQHRPEGMATLQAIAHGLGVIEGESVKAQLMKLYRVKLERALVGRGVLNPAAIVRGG
jgi:hypothetical protein